MNPPMHHDPGHGNGDADLYHAMRSATPPLDSSAYAGLERRVLHQWRALRAPAALARRGPSAVLYLGLSRRRLSLLLAITLVVACAALATLRTKQPAVDELMEPDVLSFIAMGEL